MSLSVADLFGEQELSSALQVGRHATDFAVQTSYVNRRSRWNWGISGSQIPWLVGAGIDTHTGTSSSGDALIQRDSTFEQQDHRQVAGVLMYPFNRARRVEFSTGLDAVTFSRQVTRTSFSAETLRRVDQTTSTTATGRPAMSALGGAAMVYDTAVFGVASPVMGERYRVGLTASAGDLTFATASADYRRYWPVTDNVSMAVRLEEVARLGADISDPRLLPLVWTAREIVRGYDTDAVIERASRVSVANLELRTPLGTLLRRRRMTLPVEVFAFSDWGRFAAPASARLTTDVQRLWSAGFGARLDVAGFIFEFNGVHPLADAGGWRLAVNFRPGF
jgi:hypothetical protein